MPAEGFFSIAGVFVYYFAGRGGPQVDFRFALLLVVGGVFGAYVGARLASHVPEAWLGRGVAVVLAGVGLKEGENFPLIRGSPFVRKSKAPRRPAWLLAGSSEAASTKIATTLSILFIPFISSLTQVKARRHPQEDKDNNTPSPITSLTFVILAELN